MPIPPECWRTCAHEQTFRHLPDLEVGQFSNVESARCICQTPGAILEAISSVAEVSQPPNFGAVVGLIA